MAWYAAHTILYFRLKSGNQESFPVWENIYLVSDETPDQALEEAKRLGQAASGDSGGSLSLNDQPAELVFAGVRKLISVSHGGLNNEPLSGDEITYSEFIAPNLDTVLQLAKGEGVQIEYAE